MLLTWWSVVAVASPPDRTVRLFEVDDGGGYVERMQLSSDGALLVGRTRTSKVGFLLNTNTWETDASAARSPVGSFVGPDEGGCSVSAIATSPATSGWNVWVACEDGQLLRYEYTGAGAPTLAAEDAQVEVDARLDGVWFDPESNLVYALAAADGVAGSLHTIDPSTLAVDAAATFPKVLATNGFAEGVVVESGGAPTLVISHGGSNMSHVLLGVGNNGFLQSGIAGGFGCSDMCPAPGGDVFCVDPVGAIARYQLASRLFLGLGLVLDQPRGVGASLDLDDGWLAVTGNRVFVWEMSDANTVVVDGGPYYESDPDADNPIQDIVTANGYMFGGGEAGYIHVVTQNPWIYPSTVIVSKLEGDTPVAASVFQRGDRVQLVFAVNQEGSYEVVLGGEGPNDTAGRVVAEGDLVTVDTEGGPVIAGSATFEIDGSFEEGTNFVWLRALNELGDAGHGAASIVVDNPPGAPGVGLGFGEQSIKVNIDGIPDKDLSHYVVWISDQRFAAADFATGGPTTFREPRRLVAAPGTDPSFVFEGLVNGQTYYVAARAYDESGAESVMSPVKSEIPRSVYSAAQQVGDPGGTPCSTSSGAASGMLAVLAAGALAARRRTRGLALVAALVAPAAANAQDADKDPWWRQDTTPARANMEVRYGVINLLDQTLDEHYQQGAHNLLQVEVGPQFFHVFEVDLGTGFLQELDFLRDSGGLPSDQRTMITWYPFQLDATFRAHFVDEQPVVPFVRYGWDYVLWSEKFDSAPGGPKSSIRGGKFGTHYALGGNFLLDLVQPGRASFLETRTGINDSWLTIEWRRQRVDARSAPWAGRDDQLGAAKRPLDFSGDAVTLGLKLDW